jgi:hypothetical protein
MIHRISSPRVGLVLGVVALVAGSASAQNQIGFSVDWMSTVIGQPDTAYANPITEGDILRPAAFVPAFGPLPLPGIALTGGFAPGPAGLGLLGHAPCVGHNAGTPCIVEVDAISYGNEALTGTTATPLSGNLAFSVDRQALGMFSSAFPDVLSEAACFNASSDVFVDLGLGVGPLAPFAATFPGNVGVVDGDGMVSCSGALYAGLGLPENPPPNDNLDGLAVGAPPNSFPAGGVYFSLDDTFVDPLTGIFNSGSAQAHGFVGGDVLHTAISGGVPALYAAANQLGLNLTGALDDLDALALRENGAPGYQPSLVPNDWIGGATDMLLFSVRRGSALIGQLDGWLGIPITEGDVLTTPLNGLGMPCIYVAAENLGLYARIAGAPNDDLDALDVLSGPLNDCNGNGVEDAIDIAFGFSWDTNSNGVPDECELLTRALCHCTFGSPAPCNNFYAPGGCANSTSLGAILSASGTTSVANDNLVLTTVQMPPNKVGLMLTSKTAGNGVPFKDGILCLTGQIFRYAGKPTGPNGTFAYGPGLVNYTFNNFGPNGWIFSGSTWHYQTWFRDIGVPCGTFSNLSNVIQAQFTP